MAVLIVEVFEGFNRAEKVFQERTSSRTAFKVESCDVTETYEQAVVVMMLSRDVEAIEPSYRWYVDERSQAFQNLIILIIIAKQPYFLQLMVRCLHTCEDIMIIPDVAIKPLQEFGAIDKL